MILLIFLEDIPDGPLEAVIKPGYALLVRSRANYSVKFNNNDNSDNFEVSLAFREKIIDCFNLKPASISFNDRRPKIRKVLFRSKWHTLLTCRLKSKTWPNSQTCWHYVRFRKNSENNRKYFDL